MEADRIIRDYPKGILNWYPFNPDGKALCISNEETVLAELLKEACDSVETSTADASLDSSFLDRHEGRFDYIVAIMQLELIQEPVKALSAWKRLLSSGGRLLLGVENRLGLRYFCGDRDPYTERSFDGIEHYRRIPGKDKDGLKGICFSRDEVKGFLETSGFINHKFYSVLPDLKFPQLIYAEDYLPVEELAGRYFPKYHYPDSVFLEEQYLYSDLIRNNLFHAMANAYLIECAPTRTFADVKHVTVSMDRSEEDALATIIKGNGTVEKHILYEAGRDKLKKLVDNTADLRAHGLDIIEGRIEGNAYIMPYVEGETLVTYLRRLAKTDVTYFIAEMDAFRELILKSSEPVQKENEEPGIGVILKRGYVDLVPLNCFYNSGRWIFYDQEFCEENYPANVMIFRTLGIIYLGDFELQTILPVSFFYKRYHLDEKLDLWWRMSGRFTSGLRNLKELRPFLEQYQPDYNTINTNRQRMNYSASQYQRIFVDIFPKRKLQKIVLFGAGNFTKRFLAQFKQKYPIAGIVDNNAEAWGQKLENIRISSPKLLEELMGDRPKVIICIKNYTAVARQLEQMGIKDYGIYDVNVDYPSHLTNKAMLSAETTITADTRGTAAVQKKYSVGYVAGVFDLFHVGHLNLFKKAKEQCEYLIVGVVTDEGVRRLKNNIPFIPFDERIELVRSCRYVDEAVEIPQNFGGTRDAYNMYHFDCQFSGSDYMEDPNWLAEKQFLEKHGAALVFFPYTESTSSTRIKKLIQKKLL